jgi:hypothetical protein
MFGRWLALGIWIAVLGAFTAFGARPSAHKRISQVTWTTDVERILQTRCLTCHVTGGFGPMPLETYDEARTWAKAIRDEVLERRMPPWSAAPGFGDFSNDRSLTPLEVELLTAWADGGTPIGPPVAAAHDAHDAHAAASHRSSDLVVSAPEARTIGALTERVVLDTGLAVDRWIAGWEFMPGNRSIIEQAAVSIAPSTLIGTWTPGDSAVAYPTGVAQRLPAGARVVLELHYRKSATPQTDRSGVTFHFGARPRHELRHRVLPCGASEIDRDIEALALTPRVPDAGASIEVVARRVDGSVEALSVVPRYQPAYPIAYRFRNPVPLRHGSEVDVRSSSPDCSAELDFVALQ